MRMIRRPRTYVALLVALCSIVAAKPTSAQDLRATLTPEQTRTADAAMSRLRSPVTPAHTVDMCPSTPALRDSIRMAAAAGMTPDQIVEDVIARHGEHIRILPKRSGAGLLAWLATPLLLLVGGGLIVARLWKGGAGAAPPEAPELEDPITAAERDRLTAAMRSFEKTGGMEP